MRVRSAARRRGVAPVFVAAVVVAVSAGCASPMPSGGIGPSPPAVSPRPTATSIASATIPPTAVPTDAGSGPAVIVDPALLQVLPSSVAGVVLTPDAATAAEIAADPSLASDVEALALAAAFGPLSSGDTGGDYAVATVVRLRPGAFSDGFFRGWRDTFDAGVCEQAGGVAGHAQADLGGRTTWIGTCAGGVHTYHTVLRDDTILVSVQGAGPARYGEQIMAALRE